MPREAAQSGRRTLRPCPRWHPRHPQVRMPEGLFPQACSWYVTPQVSRRALRAGRMGERAINLRDKFESFTQQWSPRVVAQMNDYQFKLVRIQGEFLWHDHPDTDETFLVLEGRLCIEFEDGSVELGAGELYVVPRGRRHKPSAGEEAKVLLIEPCGVVNTGREGGPRTAPNDLWI